MNYHFTDETKIVAGHILHRIAASAEHPFLPPSTKGGWIEGFHNLSISGAAWVADEACVFGSARVYENARLYDRSQAYGNCRIYGAARIMDDGKVFDDAEVYGHALITDSSSVCDHGKAFGRSALLEKAKLCGDAKLHGDDMNGEAVTLSLNCVLHGGDWTVSPYARGGQVWNYNISSPNSFRIGCQDHSFERWHKSWPAILRKSAPFIDFNKSIYLQTECLEYYNEACEIAGCPQYKIDPGLARSTIAKRFSVR